MDSGKFFIGREKSGEELEKKEDVVFGKAEEVGIRKVDSDKYRKIYKMLSNIVVLKERKEDLSNTYNVYSFKPSEEDYRNVVNFFREKIKRGELTGEGPYIYKIRGEDSVNWYGNLDRQELKWLIGGEEGDYFFCVDEDENILFGNAEDLPEGLRKNVQGKSIYWKKLNKTLGLIERECIDEETRQKTKCFNIIAKKRIKTEDLKDVANILKKKKAKLVFVNRAKSEKDILEEKLPL